MKQFSEFLPILVFVIAYYLYDIYTATAVFMVAVTLQLLWYLVRRQPVTGQMKFIFAIAWITGGLTLALHDETFIQWKPTIINWLMAGALIGSHYLGKDNFVRKMLGKQLELPDAVWTRLNFGWALGFTIAGILNLIVAYNFDLDFWVNYKLIGGIGITLLYVIIMITYLHRGGYIEDESATASAEDQIAEKLPKQQTEQQADL